MNCVSVDNSFKYWAYRITFASSNAASTSSSITKGADRTLRMANNNAIALKARSHRLIMKDVVISFLAVVR